MTAVNTVEAEYVIVGSGIGGLSAAIRLALLDASARIIVLTKLDVAESNTRYAQGGIAVAVDTQRDSVERHVHDTLAAGDGLCKPLVVELVVAEGVERLEELVAWGAKFDSVQGSYSLGMEGGHTAHRIVHHGDSSGWEIERSLVQFVSTLPNICVLEHCLAVDLIVKEQTYDGARTSVCAGVQVLKSDTCEQLTISSAITVIATGGIGEVYANTTNPAIATGCGIAMAARAGASISNMEFIQFHPTALYGTNEHPMPLISEAVRGFGAVLRDGDGTAFMKEYHERAELASRDIVARAIEHRMHDRNTDHVYLDCRHLAINDFRREFPNIYNKCISVGIDVAKQMIPVVPAAHYLCGGIDVNHHGCTSIANLYAVGECANTGLHGANRLASNSLLEALVFAHRCAVHAHNNRTTTIAARRIAMGEDWHRPTSIQEEREPREMRTHEQTVHLRERIQTIMSASAGIIRYQEQLLEARHSLNLIQAEVEALYTFNSATPKVCELRNLVTVARLIVAQSVARTENRGVFYKADG